MKKLIIALILIFIALPAKATDIGDILTGIFIIKEVKEEFKKEVQLDLRKVYLERGERYVRGQKIKAQTDIAIKKRKARNCLERFECNKVYFKK
jgi:hypothetical protein